MRTSLPSHVPQPDDAVPAHSALHAASSVQRAGYAPGTNEHKRLELPPRSSVVADARHAATDWCHGWDLSHLADSVELLVSELVTNAVLHAVGPVLVMADYDGSRIRVEVHDSDPGLPKPHVTAAPDLDEHGRGLQLIAMLADSWGSTSTPLGKAVWIELATAGPPPLP